MTLVSATITAALRAATASPWCRAALPIVVGLTGLAMAVPAAAGPGQPGPQAPGNAQVIITELKARGDQVIINHSGPAKALSQCTATSVRVGRHIYNQVPQRKGPSTRTLASHVMYVTVQC
ncbi:hypothetical protein [Mycobacteroides abscessus]|uniref:hypothetical protein n=1 Tax=Mycobacteroides abscessus TaxID=36809 RepID=UPI0009D1D046|nr:hypothetical protein [Mycobacteroides abscessus]SLJ59006.1 Uncharacterised protein [Mycobacteroides abscessus subsp. massiliense]